MNDTDPNPDENNFNKNYIQNIDKKNNTQKQNEYWDGSESELVFDDETENYEDNMAGIKISYKLDKNDIYEFIKNSTSYEKREREKKKLTFIQATMFAILIVLAVVTKNNLYTLVSLIPFFTGVSLWVIPILSIKNLVNNIYDENQYEVEIFPDKIEVVHAGFVKEFPLDESGRCEITDKLILVYSKTKEPLIIPIRSIKPDCLPDIQAMILAGARPI